MARPITQLTDTFKIFRDNVNTISNNVGDPVVLTTTQDSDLVFAVNELDSDLHGTGGGSVASSLTTLSYSSTAVSGGLVGAFNAVDGFIGADSSSLTTDSKTLVGSLNELHSDVITIEDSIGGGGLTTIAQTLVGAINEHDAELGATVELDSDYFVTLTNPNPSVVDGLNTLSADVIQLFDSSGALDARIGALSNLAASFDSAGATSSIVDALNHLASKIIAIYDENGVLLNT